MASRIKAHENLLLLFDRDGVPQAWFCDNVKGIIQAMFYHQLTQLEPYSHWSNASESKRFYGAKENG